MSKPSFTEPSCIQCGACADPCPRKIPVPVIIAAVDQYLETKNFIPAARKYDDATTFETCASRCVECGECAGHCVRRVQIFKYLKEAAKIFGR